MKVLELAKIMEANGGFFFMKYKNKVDFDATTS